MNKLTLLVIVLLIIILLGVLAWSQNAKTPENMPAAETDSTQALDTAPTENDAPIDTTDTSGDAMMEDTAMESDDSATPPANQEPTGDASFAALVTYTDSGFEPKTVTIAQGETVRFVNQSSGGMWVGADNHPTHALYPEKSASDCLGSSFDQCTANQTGDFWEFTFNSVGTHDYHNHVRARFGGTIIVN